MANNLVYHLRHAETKFNESTSISKWVLTKKGQKQAEALAQEGIFSNINLIITSGEKKAYQTALPLAKKLNLSITQYEDLNELFRDNEKCLSNEEYQYYVNKTLTYIQEPVGKWESGINALTRFSRKIDEIDSVFSNKNILIITHGLVINLYFAKLLESFKDLYQRWLSTTFCDYGIVKNGKVIEDIVKNK